MRLAAIFIAITVSALATAIWGWAGRPLVLPDVADGRFSCLSYSPFSENELPSDPASVVPRQRIADDLALLSRHTNCVRTYSATHGLAAVAELADAHGMEVLLGIWIGNNRQENAREIDAALAAAESYPQAIRGIIVGNEVLLRRELPPDQLVDTIRQVRSRTELPVTYADVWEFWVRNPQIAEVTDFITVHVLPFWEDEPVAVHDAQKHLADILRDLRNTFREQSF
jgi:Exo-beta-1,3-glucanase